MSDILQIWISSGLNSPWILSGDKKQSYAKLIWLSWLGSEDDDPIYILEDFCLSF